MKFKSTYLADTMTVDILIREGGSFCDDCLEPSPLLSPRPLGDDGGDGICGMCTDFVVDIDSLEGAV